MKQIGVRVDDDRPQHSGNGKANGSSNGAAKPAAAQRKIVAVYPYQDGDGATLYEVVRFEPKTFAQRIRAPGKSKGWIWSIHKGSFVRHQRGEDWYAETEERTPEKGWGDRIVIKDDTPHGLYNFPEVREEMLQAPDDRRTIYLPEGEKDCETLKAWGLLATTNSGGAANWRPDHAQQLAGADVIIPIDNDEAGRKRGDTIAKTLVEAGCKVRILDIKNFWEGCPEKGDITDWKDKASGTKEALFKIVEKLAYWSPTQFVSKFAGKPVYEFMKVRPQRDWLLKGVFLARTMFLIVGAPSCIAGDARMAYEIRDGQGRRKSTKVCSLAGLYHKFHRLRFLGQGRGKSVGRLLPLDRTIWLSSVTDDGVIIKNRVVDVIQTGFKECLRVTLSDGRSIDATADHRFLTECGYTPLSNLQPGDCVSVHSHKVKNNRKGRTTVGQRKMLYVKNHPTARTKTIEGKYKYKVVPYSRAVVEANMNGLAIDDYVSALNSGADLSWLKTLNPDDDVHHKNENFLDDSLDNLEVLTSSEHSTQHATGSLRYVTESVRIASIEPCGVKKVFDVTMEEPYSNFIASEFAVHNCGKSFLTLDFCMTRSLAAVDKSAPQEWFGRKVKPGATIYIAAEGQEDFIIRTHAWSRAKGIALDTKIPLFLIPTAIDMRSAEAKIADLTQEIKNVDAMFKLQFGIGVDLVVVDTFNRALAGGDDTKAEHVGAFYKNCTAIREATGTAIGAVHHTPKNGDSARGHGSVTADNDGEVFVAEGQNGSPNSWVVRRNKAGPKGDRFEFRLRGVTVDTDEDGEPVTSCFVAPGAIEQSLERGEMYEHDQTAKTRTAHMTADGRSILGGNLTLAMRALHELIEREGIESPPEVRAPHGRRVIKMGDWTREIIRAMPGDDKGSEKFKDRCRKMRDTAATSLRNRGIIGMDDEYVWRTSKRVANIDRPERQDGPRESPQLDDEISQLASNADPF